MALLATNAIKIQRSAAVIEPLAVTQNGSYAPPSGVDGFNPVTVNVALTTQEKTVNPSLSAQEVTPDSGYNGLSKVTVNAMPTAEQATPSITIDSNGLIIALAVQLAGYVAAGSKQGSLQLTTKSAQTYTPGTADQTINASQYLTGAQTIKGDANLLAENIAKDVTIFGVTGTHEGGSGVDWLTIVNGVPCIIFEDGEE